MNKQIKVIIDKAGNPVIEALNFDGCGCTEATKSIEEALAGNGEVSVDYKPEWANMETNENEQEVEQSW